LNFLPHEEVLALDNTYRFLRRVEHRLQIEAEQQTHTVPEEREALRRLARSMRFSSTKDFTAALRERMGSVRPIFQRIISETPADRSKINLEIFNDPKRAAKALGDLERGPGSFHVAPRTRQISRKLNPILLDWLAKTADPDATLNQFVRFVEAYGLRSLLFELLVANPKLLELVVKTFDASRFAGDLLIRRPQLLEEITRDPTFSETKPMAEHLRRLDCFGASAFHLDPVRAYRQRQILRVMLRDVLRSGRPATAKNVGPDLSDLAEACLLYTIRLLAGSQLTVIALGKFGGRELSYGADLDVLFVGWAHSSEAAAGEEIRAAQSLVVNMAQPTSEGNIWVLDARLRPEGEKGPLVCPLETYQAYYENRAQLWEIHALTRARPITGPLGARFIEMAQHYWRKAGQRDDLFDQIDNMLERIRRDRGSGSDFLDFKTGVGGIIEGEFLVQALQMRENIWEPNWERAIDHLREHGILTDAEAAKLKQAYGSLRRYESALRRYENKAVSVLTNDLSEQRKVSIRLGYDDFEAFRRDYLEAREAIHALYEQQIKSRNGD
jgi:glutamate-ammonia-ligase adenylyltransferase